MYEDELDNQTAEDCGGNCAGCSANCGSRQEPADWIEKLHPLSRVGHVIAVVSGKGGVGKSAVAAMLAVLLQRAGRRTAILDADITGPSVPKMFGLSGPPRADAEVMYPASSKFGTQVMSVNLLLDDVTRPVVWRGPIIAGTVKQFWTEVVWQDVDYMFVDMPPGTGDVPLTVFQSLPVDGIIVVSTPQELVSMVVNKAVNMARLMKVPVLGLVENYSYFTCPDCGGRHAVFGESHIADVAETHNLPVLARIPINPDIAKSADAGVIELFEGDFLDGAAEFLLRHFEG